MGVLLSKLATKNREAGKEIERQISSILALEELENEDIDDILKQVFQQLKGARGEAFRKKGSILEHLEDDELMGIIKTFKEMLPKISNKLNKEREMLQEAIREGDRKAYQLEKTSREILSNQYKIKNLSPEKPGIWENTIADEQPGLITRFLLLFVSQESIDAAKRKRADYQNRIDLIKNNDDLDLTKKQLEKEVGASEEKVTTRTKKVGELDLYHSVLRTSIEKLEENASALIPKMTANKKQKTAQVKPEEPDEMMFTMDL
ncbi:hypothetical protein [Legionella sp. WA2022007384]